MAIVNVTGIPAVSLQTETIIPKAKIINELKFRFDNIYLLYDNDYDKEINWGREFGLKLSEEFDLCQIEIDEEMKSKDFSDLVKNHGTKEAGEYLKSLLNPF